MGRLTGHLRNQVTLESGCLASRYYRNCYFGGESAALSGHPSYFDVVYEATLATVTGSVFHSNVVFVSVLDVALAILSL